MGASGRTDLHHFFLPSSTKDLRRQVLGRPAERVGLVRVLHVELAQSEIAESDVARVVEQNVLRLQVAGITLLVQTYRPRVDVIDLPVHDVQLVEMLKSKK